MRHIEFARTCALATPFHQISTFFAELNDAVVPVSIGNEDIAIGGYCRIGWPIEGIGQRATKSSGT